jgi:hypothetical protein
MHFALLILLPKGNGAVLFDDRPGRPSHMILKVSWVRVLPVSSFLMLGKRKLLDVGEEEEICGCKIR